MKTWSLNFCVVLLALLLSACVPNQTPTTQPEQTLLLTDVPVATPIDTPPPAIAPIAPTSSEPSTSEEAGPVVVKLGDLTMEMYELVLKAPNDNGSFTTTAGLSSKILENRRPLRDIQVQAFSPAPLDGRQLKYTRIESDGQTTVTFMLDDEEVLTVDCGSVSPISDVRGMWVVGEDWYGEVAHVENEAEGNVVTSNALGELFMNGVSLNDQLDYDETFGFQPLDDKPFYFFSKDGEIGINYAGKTYKLGFDSVKHYACCSAGAYNPKAYLTMVTFFAQKDNREYYVELGHFSTSDTTAIDLSGAGLTVEAYWLEDDSWPDNDHIQSRPIGSLPGWVQNRHKAERVVSAQSQQTTLFQEKALTASTNIDTITDVRVEVRLDDEVILSVPAGDLSHSAGMDAVIGVWVHGENWYVETVHVVSATAENTIQNTPFGEIFRNGESLSQMFGYDETFGFQVLDGEPFYFFKKGGEFGLNHAGEEVMLGFDEIAHYYCCGFSVYNPMHYENMVTFFASREGKRYYVEAGVFE